MVLPAIRQMLVGPVLAVYEPYGHELCSRILDRTERLFDGWTMSDARTAEARYNSGVDDNGQPIPAYTVANGIGTLRIQGTLVKDDNWWNEYMGCFSTAKGCKTLDAMAKDPLVQTIHLSMDSPGGMVAGSTQMADLTYKINSNASGKKRGTGTGKKIVAYVDDMCASACYHIASQCEEIHASSTSIVGSIGTYMVMYDYSKMFADMGVEPVVIKSGKYKGTGIIGTKITADQKKKLQENVNDMNAIFTSNVMRGRGFDQTTMDALATGETWIGQTAANLDLIDGICTEEDLLTKLAADCNGGATTTTRRSVMAKGNVATLAARIIGLLSTHEEDDTEQTEEETETEQAGIRRPAPRTTTLPARSGGEPNRSARLSRSASQGFDSVLLEAFENELTAMGVTSVEQLQAMADEAEVGRKYRTAAVDYAQKQAIRLYGATGAKMSAGLDRASMDEIESAALRWETEADLKWGIGKDGVQVQGRQSASVQLHGEPTIMRREAQHYEAHGSNSEVDEDGNVVLDAKRRRELLGATAIGKQVLAREQK